jgi:hypothetical protein
VSRGGRAKWGGDLGGGEDASYFQFIFWTNLIFLINFPSLYSPTQEGRFSLFERRTKLILQLILTYFPVLSSFLHISEDGNGKNSLVGSSLIPSPAGGQGTRDSPSKGLFLIQVSNIQLCPPLYVLFTQVLQFESLSDFS